MDPELQALREARLAELKRGNNASGQSPNGGAENGKNAAVGSDIASFLEPQALERLSRVSLVRPERAQAVEMYIKQLLGSGQLSHKISEDEIVQILNGIAREQKKKNDVKIIFNRREQNYDNSLRNNSNDDDDEDDDFFD
ncbi:hypothetical protein TPHA_0C04210 [Tetrapisispora phaffii CBS 4417]|uniref:Programmed cell death protein 5 n=1 Tax=Tetrapisispora phaffii (strain ATCC 24235 / CBS 4417 / NBRC 1672 / NRRL Y-8282 / UCD 70-5) TaxID=1071381 RepID=G8BQQ9_TETPH|nr:hypothetical protein TPHA_0C04210 [Tetrapisispora phaffii CBS 4417]CCE62571.1 hypothetical protein TPHA_0C04210 [Tetrapisispora phaffii CBS 4417]